jgi:Mg-chelatase subunit ChlD
VAIGLLSTLVYLLLVSPKMTPVVAITAIDYAPPIPLNPWAREDRDALAALHEQNITFYDASGEWSTQGGTNTNLLPADLLASRPRDKEPVIVYISAHGIVNEKAEPCLLRPGASVYDATSWIRVEDLLERINSTVPQARSKLVILDCGRIRVNWSLGILYNSFVERVEQVVDTLSVQNLAVLTSAAPGQTNWAAADLGGSVFGRYLQLGLAGAADNLEGENSGDGAVNLRELAAYLERNIDGWSRFNRGEPQKPLLLPADVADFRLTWVIPQGDLADLEDQFRTQKAAVPAIPPEDLGALWTKLADLRDRELVRYDPIACRDLEHELLRLEELSNGGAAYLEQAKRQFDLVNGKLTEAAGRANSADESHALADHSGIVTPAKWTRVQSAAYSLPVSEYFGSHNNEEVKQVQSLWTSLIQTSDQQDTSAIIERSGAKAVAKDLAETQLVTALREQHVSSLWRRRPVDLRNVLRQRNTAERLAVPSRPDGTPGDERAHYHARLALDKADAARRTAEDVLFVGEDNAPEHYEVLTERANKLYEQAGQVMEVATAGYRAHDLASAETPYLAAWMCSPLASELSDRDNSIQQIGRLIRNTRDLGQSINQHESLAKTSVAAGSDSQPYRELANEVQQDFQLVKSKIEAHCNGLSEGTAQGAPGWRAIEAVLQVPLIPGETRAQMLTNRSKISAELHQQYLKPDAPPVAAAKESGADYLETLAEWSPHPFVELMHTAGLSDGAAISGDARADRVAWCEAFGAQARRRLAELPASSSAAGAGETPADDGDPQERDQLSLAERQLRAAAAIDFESAEAASDPILELRRFDLQQLLVWHGRRVLDDFWGGVSNPGGEESFFARAVRGYLQATEALGGPLSLAVRDQIEDLKGLLSERLEAKRSPLQIAAAARLLIEPANSIAISLDVTTKSHAQQYPVGLAAVHVRGTGKRLADVAFARSTAGAKSFIELPPDQDKPQHLEATVADSAITSSMLEAVAFFRGREDVSREFPVPVLKGVVIDYQPHRYEQQRITLFGDRLQRTSYLFVLDCSSSMAIEDVVEERADAPETKQRIELAKSALNDMLRDLAIRNRNGEDARVGVWAFGHRMGWTVPTPGVPRPPNWQSTIKRQADYEVAIPQDLSPAIDVEEIFSLGRFDDTAAGQVRRRLDTVKEAIGQSPLFLALAKVLEKFQNEDPDTRKVIIVISDGVNVQFTPSRILNRPRDTTQEDVLAAMRRLREPIPIHILGFDISESEAARAGSVYQQIARGSGGSFLEVESGADLLRQLRDRLDVDGYIVRDSGQQPVNPMRGGEVLPSKLNFAVAIPADRHLPQEFSVHFRMVQPKRVLVEGGEAIELQVTQQGATQDIAARPYDRSVADQANLVNGLGGSPTNHIVRVHRPVRRDGSVRFPVSLQVDPSVSHFTRRPVETWVEVAPLAGSTSAGETYVFYDRNLEPETPVPVLMWTAQNWPEQASRARVKYWCKYETTDPVQTISWRDVLNSPTTYRGFQPVRGVPGVQLSVESSAESNGSYRIYLVERHSPQSPGIDAVRIHLETPSEALPVRVTHQFDSKNRIAMHSYFFSPDQRELVDRSELSKIQIAAAEDVKASALQLAEGTNLEVPIDDSGELFSPRATASGQ